MAMAPQLSEDELDDVVYLARTGQDADLTETLTSLAVREQTTTAAILIAASDEGKSTTLHMAAGNGHKGVSEAGISLFIGLCRRLISWGWKIYAKSVVVFTD